MRLYHGSNQIVVQPNPAFSKRNKMDFGKGFYTTTSEEQARRFTHLVLARNKGQGRKTSKSIEYLKFLKALEVE